MTAREREREKRDREKFFISDLIFQLEKRMDRIFCYMVVYGMN